VRHSLCSAIAPQRACHLAPVKISLSFFEAHWQTDFHGLSELSVYSHTVLAHAQANEANRSLELLGASVVGPMEVRLKHFTLKLRGLFADCWLGWLPLAASPRGHRDDRDGSSSDIHIRAERRATRVDLHATPDADAGRHRRNPAPQRPVERGGHKRWRLPVLAAAAAAGRLTRGLCCQQPAEPARVGKDHVCHSGAVAGRCSVTANVRVPCSGLPV